ncbi:hypothetical protein K7185_08060 [Clostridium butyricum]|nr:hypothetical protein [Clostridium butyricum]
MIWSRKRHYVAPLLTNPASSGLAPAVTRETALRFLKGVKWTLCLFSICVIVFYVSKGPFLMFLTHITSSCYVQTKETFELALKADCMMKLPLHSFSYLRFIYVFII